MFGTSSTKVLGGELVSMVTRRRLFLAMITAHSNLLCRFLLESAAYQPAPLRGLPLARGIARARINARVSRTLLLLLCSNKLQTHTKTSGKASEGINYGCLPLKPRA
jgi:hypothetical protein